MVFSYLANRPNDIIAKQKEWLKPSPYPLFLRTPGRRVSFALYTVFLAGLLGADAWGAYQLIKGDSSGQA